MDVGTECESHELASLVQQYGRAPAQSGGTPRNYGLLHKAGGHHQDTDLVINIAQSSISLVAHVKANNLALIVRVIDAVLFNEVFLTFFITLRSLLTCMAP